VSRPLPASGLASFALPALLVVALSLPVAVWLLIGGEASSPPVEALAYEGTLTREPWARDAAAVALLSVATVVAALFTAPSGAGGRHVPPDRPTRGRAVLALVISALGLAAAAVLVGYVEQEPTRLLGAYFVEPWWTDAAGLATAILGIVGAGVVVSPRRMRARATTPT